MEIEIEHNKGGEMNDDKGKGYLLGIYGLVCFVVGVIVCIGFMATTRSGCFETKAGMYAEMNNTMMLGYTVVALFVATIILGIVARKKGVPKNWTKRLNVIIPLSMIATPWFLIGTFFVPLAYGSGICVVESGNCIKCSTSR